ncbi:MAG: HDIG domain-containing protein [Planctomycetaceae bacterium]
MFFLGSRKKRFQRGAELGPTSVFSAWLPRLFWDRKILVPLLMAVVAVCLLVVVVEGWKTVFPFRLGDRVESDITARVDFKRLNIAATERARLDAENSVAPIFIHSPEKLESLPTKFRGSLQELSKAETLGDVSPEIRTSFGLSGTDNPNGSMPDQLEREFSNLKKAISPKDDSAGMRINKLVEDFTRFIAPMKKVGRANPATFEEYQLTYGSEITVQTADGKQRQTGILLDDVQLEMALKETGLLGKNWNEFPDLKSFQEMLKRWLLAETPVTLRYDPEATLNARRAAREKVPNIYDSFERGQRLVEAGKVIDLESLAVLQAEYEALERTISPIQRIGRVITVSIMFIVLAILVGYYLVHNEPRLMQSPGRIAVYLSTILIAVAAGRFLATGSWRAEIIPITATVMVFSIAYNQRLATITALVLSLIIALSTSSQLPHFVVLMSVSAAAIIPLSHVPSRSMLIKVGFWSAVVYFGISWGMGIVQNQTAVGAWTDLNLLLTSLKGAGCCLVTGYLVAGSLPFVESAFGIVTDISLLEMSDVSHPLLQELIRRAPGTYNHSMTVASIGETAADSIGANGLLVRVGAYFHDIGKMLKPEYFIENQTEDSTSRHEHLAPAMSTLIIIGHVKDGVDLAMQHNLPQGIIDFIEQHHGTTLVEYFYHEASKQAQEQPDHKTDAEESSFRYPGPKPQSKEAGVMMLADAVESASRTLTEPTPKRIGTLVEKITMKRLLDGQFDESTLTLSEIRTVEESLKKSLIGIYHGRIKYPEQRTA